MVLFRFNPCERVWGYLSRMRAGIQCWNIPFFIKEVVPYTKNK